MRLSFIFFAILMDHAVTGNVKIRCSFVFMGNVVPPVPYKCLTLGLDVQMNDMNISSITGYHHYIKTNKLVQRVEIINEWWSSYLPNGFALFFPNLLEFEVRYTPLKGIKRSIFLKMSKLVILSIEGTELTNIPDDTFIDLISLEELTIRKSFIATISPNIFSPLRTLRSFDGKHNRISSLDEKLFSENFKIEMINFTGNNLKNIRLDFTSLENILEIYLFNCGCINAYFIEHGSIFTILDFKKLITKRCSS